MVDQWHSRAPEAGSDWVWSSTLPELAARANMSCANFALRFKTSWAYRPLPTSLGGACI
jgi:hypothetical protein